MGSGWSPPLGQLPIEKSLTNKFKTTKQKFRENVLCLEKLKQNLNKDLKKFKQVKLNLKSLETLRNFREQRQKLKVKYWKI